FAFELVAGAQFEVAGVVTLGQLLFRRAPGAIDYLPAAHGRAPGNDFGPALNVGVAGRVEELGRTVDFVAHQCAIPWPDRHVGDGVVRAGDVFSLGQSAIEHVELALDLHG